MKKLIFVETGKEVEMGKTLAFGMNSAYGFIPFYTVIVCEKSIPFLIEVAIVLDEKYDNHIENSKEIYVISCLNGEISKVKDLNKIKNFKNFAAFRTLEDAITAKKILEEPMKQLFKRDGKQEN